MMSLNRPSLCIHTAMVFRFFKWTHYKLGLAFTRNSRANKENNMFCHQRLRILSDWTMKIRKNKNLWIFFLVPDTSSLWFAVFQNQNNVLNSKCNIYKLEPSSEGQIELCPSIRMSPQIPSVHIEAIPWLFLFRASRENLPAVELSHVQCPLKQAFLAGFALCRSASQKIIDKHPYIRHFSAVSIHIFSPSLIFRPSKNQKILCWFLRVYPLIPRLGIRLGGFVCQRELPQKGMERLSHDDVYTIAHMRTMLLEYLRRSSYIYQHLPEQNLSPRDVVKLMHHGAYGGMGCTGDGGIPASCLLS